MAIESGRRAFLRLGGAWLLLCGSGVTAAPPVVGMVGAVSGGVTRVRPTPAQPATLGQSLRVGDSLRLAPGARVRLVRFSDGAYSEFSGPDTLIVQARDWKASRPGRSLPQLDASLLRAPAAVGSRRGSTVHRSVSPHTREPSLLLAMPVGVLRRFDEAQVRWSAANLPADATLELVVREATGKRVERQTGIAVAAGRATLTAPLTPQVRYRVRIECDAPLLWDEAEFSVLSSDDLANLEQAESATRARSAVDPTDPVPELLLGRLQERLGLNDEARRSYQAALKKSPGNTALIEVLRSLP